MNRTALNDVELTWKAKGLLAYMLSMPDDWTFYDTELEKHARDGKDSLKSAIKELKLMGYMKRYRKRNSEGKLDWETSVFETPYRDKPYMDKPLVDKPYMDKPSMDKPSMDNPQLLSTDELSTDELSTDELSTDELSIDELSIDKPSNDIPYVEIVTYLNDATSSKYKHTTNKTKDLIKARWNEGFRLEDFKRVIDVKSGEWLKKDDMSKYLRPDTLFSSKFEGYLNQKGDVNGWNGKNGKSYPKDEREGAILGNRTGWIGRDRV